jgi:AcrR family transcriptional regulator
MRKIAQLLRVEAMSLYNHVKNKDEILDGLVELVVAEIEVPAIDGEWKEQMRKRASSAHSVLMKHPWATMLLMSRVNIGPLMLRYVDATLGCLFHAGFDIALADHAWNTLDSYIYGFTLQSLNFPFAPDEYKDAAAEVMPQLPMDQYPHLARLSFGVMEGKHDGIHDLSFGLELLLDGLEGSRQQG